jgi:hypothetical protein
MSFLRQLLWTFLFVLQLCPSWAFVSMDNPTIDLSAGATFLDLGSTHSLPTLRWGEALHPGPEGDCHLFGFSNPSGLARKNMLRWIWDQACGHFRRHSSHGSHSVLVANNFDILLLLNIGKCESTWEHQSLPGPLLNGLVPGQVS